MLRVRAAIVSVVCVENAFVRGAAADIVVIAAFAVIDGVARGRVRVVEQAKQQRMALVVLAHKGMTELMADS